MKTQTMKLIALRPFLHGYNVLSVGDALVTTPGHAKQLVQLGHARPDLVPEPVVSVSAALGTPLSTESTTQDEAPQAAAATTGPDGAAVDSGESANAPAIADLAPASAAEPNADTGAAAGDAGSSSSSSSDADDATSDTPQGAQGEPAAGNGDLLGGTTGSSGGAEPPERTTEEGADAEAKAATRQRRRAS